MRLFSSIVGLLLLVLSTPSIQAQEIPFEAEKSKQYRVMRFSASWCAPCKVYDQRFTDGVNAQCKTLGVQNYYYDIDKPGNKALFDRLKLKSIPALILVEVLPDNKIKPVKRWGGQSDGSKLLSVEELKQFVDPEREGPHKDLPKTLPVSYIPFVQPSIVFIQAPRLHNYSPRWTVDGGYGNTRNHMSGFHGVDTSGKSQAQLLFEHDSIHNRIGPVSGATIRRFQSQSRSRSYCPPGNSL